MNTIIERKRLFDALKPQSLPRLLLITGPSGYGKTIAAEQLVAWTQYKAIWQRLNQWERDWLSIAEHSQALWGIKEKLDFSAISPSEAGRRLAQAFPVDKPSLYLLDDVQYLIGSPNAELWLQSLIENLPPSVHLVLVGQDLPHLSWMQFLARDWVWSINRDALRFTKSEIQTLGQVSDAEAEDLSRRTDGWIAGIRLLLNPAAQATAQGLAAHTRPDERLFADLARAFFKRQSPDFQDFLLRTALPESFESELCQRVLGLEQIAGHLGVLQRQHFFISSEAGSYRYHDLFRNFLLGYFHSEDLAGYQHWHKAFGLWYEETEQPEKAIWHFIQADDLPRASHLADKIAKEFQMLGRWESLLRILNLLGASASSHLQLLCAIILTELNRLDDSEQLLHLALQTARVQGDRDKGSRCSLQLAFNYNKQGQHRDALQQSQAVLEDKTANADLKTWAARVQGWSYLDLGDTTAAIAALESALPHMSQQERAHGRSHLLQDLSIAYISFGDLETAGMLLQEVFALRRQIKNHQDLALALNDLGFYYHCRSQYEDALRSFSEALAYVESSGGRAASYLEWSRGDVLRDLGRFEEAEQAYLNAMRHTGRSYQAPYQAILMSMAQLRFWQGRYADSAALLGESQKLLIHPDSVRSCLLSLMQVVFVPSTENLDTDQLFSSFENLKNTHCLLELAQALGFCLEALFRQGKTEFKPQFLAYVKELPADLLQALAANIHNLGDLDLVAEILESLPLPALHEALDKLRLQAQTPVLSAYPVKAMPVNIKLKTLGRGEVVMNGEILEDSLWTVASAKELFFYLYFKGAQSKDEIAAAFWPERSPQQIRNAIHDSLKRLRRAIPEGISFDGVAYQINPQHHISSDSQQFRDYIHRASQLPPRDVRAEDLFQKALQLYQGIFLPAVYSPWVEVLREELEADYLKMLLGLADCALQRHDPKTAIQFYKRALVKDPYNETVLRCLMAVYAAAGERAAIQLCFDEFAKRLEDDLDISPSQATWDVLFQLIKATN